VRVTEQNGKQNGLTPTFSDGQREAFRFEWRAAVITQEAFGVCFHCFYTQLNEHANYGSSEETVGFWKTFSYGAGIIKKYCSCIAALRRAREKERFPFFHLVKDV
jgi:hypothetical protein